MITTITSQYQNQYRELFDSAYKVLEAAGKLPTEIVKDPETGLEEERPVAAITSLEQYFFCLGDLYALAKGEGHKYAMLLPLDEPMFEIDANARVINIPASFKKHGIAVQGDVIAETLLFKISRFFDSVDLNDTNVWVQWKKADGTEGVSEIKFKYIDMHPEQLIFAWPITSRVTDLPGALNFAVRFEKRTGDTINYSLNTIPAVVNVNKALTTSTVYEDVDDASTLFTNAIQNSQHISGAQNVAVSRPEWIEPEISAELASQAEIDLGNVNLIDNTLTLKAQAIVADTGNVTYKWTQTGGAIVEDRFEYTEDEVPNTSKRYYKVEKDEGGNVIAFIPYTESTFPSDPVERQKICERFTTLTIKEGAEPVTGSYVVQAFNRLGWGSKESSKLKWTIPGPVDPSVEALSNTYVITELTNQLTAIASNTDHGVLNYQWEINQVDPEKEEKWIAISEAVDATYALVTELPEEGLGSAGWYRVKVTNTKNRDTTEAVATNACKTTYMPQPLELSLPQDQREKVGYSAIGELKVLSFEASIPASVLQSEKVSYYWFEEANDIVSATFENGKLTVYNADGEVASSAMQITGKVEELLNRPEEPQDYTLAEGLETSTLVLPAKDPYTGTWRCVVVNELNGNFVCSVTGAFEFTNA